MALWSVCWSWLTPILIARNSVLMPFIVFLHSGRIEVLHSIFCILIWKTMIFLIKNTFAEVCVWHKLSSERNILLAISQPVKVTLHGSLALQHTDHSPHFAVFQKFVESVLHPTIQVINENIKKYLIHYWSLWDATTYWFLSGLCSTTHKAQYWR